MRDDRTQVAIIGAGPAGLLLSHLLHLQGIDSVVLETRSRAEIESTIRAGVLEQGTMDLLVQAGVGARMQREGALHHGIGLAFDGRRHRIDLTELTGHAITVYAQHEVIKDLVAARLAAGGQLYFEVSEVAVQGLEGNTPGATFVHCGQARTLRADFIAGCDGFHGICRPLIPETIRQDCQRIYPFGWFGILVEGPPSSDELIYAHHPRGFALVSTRSPNVQRLYFQCDPKDNVDDWSHDRIWAEMHARLDGENWQVTEGKIFQKNIVGLRSFVSTPMQHGRLFLAGDAAHIVPPTGAKGMNLAVADVRVLSEALDTFYARGDDTALAQYSQTALKRVWRAEYYSWWLTSLMHTFENHSAFERHMQRAEQEFLVSSRAMQTALAENYVGAF